MERPYCSVYGCHSYGQWFGQLGDGRAIYLGETHTTQGISSTQRNSNESIFLRKTRIAIERKWKITLQSWIRWESSLAIECQRVSCLGSNVLFTSTYHESINAGENW